MSRRRITAKHLSGLPGVRRTAVAALVEHQPKTVADALDIPDVGLLATGHLLELGLLSDPDGTQAGALPPRFQRLMFSRRAERKFVGTGEVYIHLGDGSEFVGIRVK